MKIINFSVTEILPALLNKTKTQTIRRAFLTREEHLIRCPICYTFEKKRFEGKPITRSEQLGINGQVNCKQDSWIKPPRFKVGDEVVILWKGDMEAYGKIAKSKVVHKLGYPIRLGKAKITEVFEIEIHEYQVADNDEPLRNKYAVNCKSLIANDLFDGKILAKRDGFKSAEDMFDLLDKMYALSSPKKFYVYRWRWLK